MSPKERISAVCHQGIRVIFDDLNIPDCGYYEDGYCHLLGMVPDGLYAEIDGKPVDIEIVDKEMCTSLYSERNTIILNEDAARLN